MTREESNRQIDSILMPFLQATDETEAQRLLEQLIAHAAPTIKNVTSRSRDPEDTFQETVRRLIKYLWLLKADPGGKAIGNYISYVSRIASRIGIEEYREQQ